MIVSADFSVLFNQDNGVDHVFDIDEVRNLFLRIDNGYRFTFNRAINDHGDRTIRLLERSECGRYEQTADRKAV